MADKDDPTTHEGAAAEAEAEEATNDDSATGSAKDDAAQGKASDDSATESAEDDAAQDKASDDKQKKKSSDGAAKSEEEPKDKGPSRAARVKQRVQSGFSWRWAAAGAVIVALGGVIVFGSFRYRDVTRDLAQVHQEQADRDKAAQMAKDYALKSLTYTWQDPDGFFKSVEDGVAPPLKDKYLNVAELLKGIMAQAKVESSGEILAADVTPQPGGSYQVVVSASQTTRNLQNPQPRVSPIILQVVVNKIGNTWQIADIGPKTGGKPAPGEQAPPGIGGGAPAVPPAKPNGAPAVPPVRPNGAPAVPGLH